MFAEICDSAGAGICDGAPSTLALVVFFLFFFFFFFFYVIWIIHNRTEIL